jgi:hypothetical protein
MIKSLSLRKCCTGDKFDYSRSGDLSLKMLVVDSCNFMDDGFAIINALNLIKFFTHGRG